MMKISGLWSPYGRLAEKSCFNSRVDGTVRTILAAAGFALVWTTILSVAYSNAGLHPDVLKPGHLDEPSRGAIPTIRR
jgi:hypothetical protein